MNEISVSHNACKTFINIIIEDYEGSTDYIHLKKNNLGAFCVRHKYNMYSGKQLYRISIKMCTRIIFYNTYGFADFKGTFLMLSYLKTRTIHVDNTGTASKSF